MPTEPCLLCVGQKPDHPFSVSKSAFMEFPGCCCPLPWLFLDTHQWKRPQRCQIKMDFDWSLSHPSPNVQLAWGPNNVMLKKNGTASEQPVQHHIPPHHTHRPYHIPAYPDPFGGTSSKARNIGIVFEARLRRNSGIQYYPIITPGSFLEFTVNSHMRQFKSY